MPRSDEYSSRIVPADAMVIDFGVNNQVVVLWKSLFKAALKRHETDPLLSSVIGHGILAGKYLAEYRDLLK
jgi:hypothetical protein